MAEARRHMPSLSLIVGCGKKRNYQEGHAHSQMSTTQIDYATTPVLPINSSACKIPAFINNIRALVLYRILVLLSHATLQANQCIIDTHSGQLQFAAGRNMTLPLSVTLNEAAAHVNTLGTTLHIPPGSVIEVMDQLPVLGLWRVQ